MAAAPPRPLAGRAALVTGGASGMGRATALALARHGADVAIGSLVRSQREQVVLPGQNAHTPDDAMLEETRAAIAGEGVAALAMALDVATDDSVRAFFEAAVGAFGKVDILINAAGSSARQLMVEHDDALWQRMLEVNLNGPYRTSKLALPGMIERGWGRIVDFSSTAGQVGFERHSAYCASKHAVLGLTRFVALEGAPHGVTCNAICPGWTATDSARSAVIQEMVIAGIQGMAIEDYWAEQTRRHVPQNRMMDPSEPGGYAVWLCLDEARGITGEVLRIAAGSSW